MSDKLIIKDKEIVVPGELLAEGLAYLPSGKAHRKDKNIYASTVGLVNIKGKVIKVIPLAGAYVPAAGDDVIGKITNIGHSGWSVSIGGPFDADLNIGEASMSYINLNKTSLNDIYDIDDYISAKIKMITPTGFVKLTTKENKYHRLKSGNIIKVSPTKIPRIIGKKGSMIATIKDSTNCSIFVGQNGVIWINGEAAMVKLVGEAIKLIENESHMKGLTNKIKALLDKKAKKVKK